MVSYSHRRKRTDHVLSQPDISCANDNAGSLALTRPSDSRRLCARERSLSLVQKTAETAPKAPAQPHEAPKKRLSRLLKENRGQGIVEYVLMLALVALGVVAGEQSFACQVECAFENGANQLEQIIMKGKKIPPGQAKKCSKQCA
jgi:Flp pilus assembly pilin Flp